MISLKRQGALGTHSLYKGIEVLVLTCQLNLNIAATLGPRAVFMDASGPSSELTK